MVNKLPCPKCQGNFFNYRLRNTFLLNKWYDTYRVSDQCIDDTWPICPILLGPDVPYYLANMFHIIRRRYSTTWPSYRHITLPTCMSLMNWAISVELWFGSVIVRAAMHLAIDWNACNAYNTLTTRHTLVYWLERLQNIQHFSLSSDNTWHVSSSSDNTSLSYQTVPVDALSEQLLHLL